MFRFLRRLLVVLVLLGVAVVLGRNTIGNWMGAAVFRKATGFPTFISALDIKLTRPEIVMRDVAIRNPLDAFREPRAVEISRLEATYAPGSMLRGPPHFRRVVMEISEVVVVKNAAGETNLKRFQHDVDPKHREGTSGYSRKFQIDELVVSLGNVLYLDESRGSAQPRVFAVNAHKQVYRNVKSSKDIQKIVMNLVTKALPANLYLIPETVNSVKETVEKGTSGLLDLFRKKEPATQ